MEFDYLAKVNYYSFLLGHPRAWQLVMSSVLTIKRGDSIKVIEVDSAGNPTGNVMYGDVLYVHCNNVFTYSTNDRLVHVVPYS